MRFPSTPRLLDLIMPRSQSQNIDSHRHGKEEAAPPPLHRGGETLDLK